MSHPKRNEGYFEQAHLRAKRHKEARAAKAAARKAYWLKRRVKRNGKPVRGIICEQTAH